MRNETLGFLRHAHLMAQNALIAIGKEWDDPEVNFTPLQTREMRKEVMEIQRIVRELEPFVQEFEKVASARLSTLIEAA